MKYALRIFVIKNTFEKISERHITGISSAIPPEISLAISPYAYAKISPGVLPGLQPEIPLDIFLNVLPGILSGT